MTAIEPCLCGDPGCARCGGGKDLRLYANADHCDHPEPPRDTDEWDVWVDDHPTSPTPEVDRVCLFTPIGWLDDEDEDEEEDR